MTLGPGILRSSHRASLLMLGATLGCAVTSPDVYLARKFADEGFTYESLREHGMGVLGVTSSSFDVQGTTATTDWLGPWLFSELERERDDLELVSPQEIAAALGDELYIRVLDTHSGSAALDSITLRDMATGLSVPRFLAVAHVDSDRVEYRQTFSQQDEYDTSCTVQMADMWARARAKVRLQVYDLAARRQVWEGMCQSERERKATKFVARRCSDPLESMTQSVLFSLLGVDNDDEVFVEYPDAPKFSGVLRPCFKRFARRLPSAAEPR